MIQRSCGAYSVELPLSMIAGFLLTLRPISNRSNRDTLRCCDATRQAHRAGRFRWYSGLSHLSYPSCAEIGLSTNRLPRLRRKERASCEIRHCGILCNVEGVGRNLLVGKSQQIGWPLCMAIVAGPGTIYTLTASDEDLRILDKAILFNGIGIQASMWRQG